MKELVPKDKYGVFADIQDTKQSGQWVYVIEKEDSRVKIGVTTNLEYRIKTLELQGGFRVTRIGVFGPFDNGYSIETEALRMFKAQRIIGEWFNVDFQEVTDSISKIAKEVGRKNKETSPELPDFSDIINYFWPIPPKFKMEVSLPEDSPFRVIVDENGTTWLEHDDHGLLSPALFNTLMIIANDKPKGGSY